MLSADRQWEKALLTHITTEIEPDMVLLQSPCFVKAILVYGRLARQKSSCQATEQGSGTG